jgi:outer membrane protein assembly factor BamB
MDPNPEQARELTHFAAFNGKTWNPPALAGEYLLVRNDKEAACYRLPTVKD